MGPYLQTTVVVALLLLGLMVLFSVLGDGYAVILVLPLAPVYAALMFLATRLLVGRSRQVVARPAFVLAVIFPGLAVVNGYAALWLLRAAMLADNAPPTSGSVASLVTDVGVGHGFGLAVATLIGYAALGYRLCRRPPLAPTRDGPNEAART
ncbi:hypothetical protein [Prosthecomicrobium sp. N25]|uniref:hypothetical protein n=1 Tax=Prosthecomicrobium sp. N25 TaxID=3129254 RepID=UPI003078104A